jgi:hypothetical protein
MTEPMPLDPSTDWLAGCVALDGGGLHQDRDGSVAPLILLCQIA